jgi:hypothetical protein
MGRDGRLRERWKMLREMEGGEVMEDWKRDGRWEWKWKMAR